jgi:hypothetical protein
LLYPTEMGSRLLPEDCQLLSYVNYDKWIVTVS